MPPPLEPGRSQVSLVTVLTVCAGVLLVLGLVMLVIHSLVALTLTVSALMIAVAMDHGAAFLVRRRLNRGLAVAIVTTTILAVMVGVGFLVFPKTIAQGKALAARAPHLVDQARSTRLFQNIDAHLHVADRVNQFQQRLPQLISSAAGPLLRFVGSLVNLLGALVTIFFLAIFMLVFGSQVVDAALAETLPERRHRYVAVLDKIYNLIGGYLGGLLLICSINALLTTTFLAILGFDVYLPLGILSGFSSLVPYAGPFVTGAAISTLAVVTAGPWKGLACVIFFVMYGQLEGNILGPLIFRRTVHVNPLIVMLSILFFAEIAGIMGAVLAVPISAAVQILLREFLRDRRERLNLARTALNTPTETT